MCDDVVFEVHSDEGRVKSFSFLFQAIEHAKLNGFSVKYRGDVIYPTHPFAVEHIKNLNELSLGYFNDLFATRESIDKYQEAIYNLKILIHRSKDSINAIKKIMELYTLRNQLLVEQNSVTPDSLA